MVLKAPKRLEPEARNPRGRKAGGDFFARFFAAANLFNVAPVE
jgi:hypothetical protein